MLIEPRTLKGFRDFLPEQMIPRERIIETAKRVYRSFGFAPIDTPALEYLEILQGKGGDESDRLMYRFQDHGGRDVGMRFDLTVPLARFAAQHIDTLGTPFKRYHMATVWRGENTHRGRYREFMQCDFDTIGTRSVAADAETVVVIHELLRAIGLDKFTIRINHRGALNGVLAKLGVADRAADVLRCIDKLDKISPDAVAAELQEKVGLDATSAGKILSFCLGESGASSAKDIERTLAFLGEQVKGSEAGEAGVATLAELFKLARSAGVSEANLDLDVKIARGLDYYTGVVFETRLDELPTIGSVCSGGRYDNLAELYTKQELPGIGASLGLDRFLAALEELGRLDKVQTTAPVLIPQFDASRLGDYFAMASALRHHGVGCEVYPEPKKLGQQLKYADRKGFRLVLIAGGNEFAEGVCQIKDLLTGQQDNVPFGDNYSGLVSATLTALRETYVA
jgi:histidyl-tRNA synthetase